MKAKIKVAEHLKHYFDGSKNYEQVENVTIGKTYEIIEVKSYGVESKDYTFIDDKEEEQTLADFFFE